MTRHFRLRLVDRGLRGVARQSRKRSAARQSMRTTWRPIGVSEATGSGGKLAAALSLERKAPLNLSRAGNWLRGRDLNPRPSGYEPDELPGCSTPRFRR